MTAGKDEGHVVALSGGIGGAKLALGLYRVLPADRLIVVANTGDDFEHLGLHVSPDLDTLMYTLAGINHPEQGWGRANETWTCLNSLEALGGETWFRLGDGDLATHLERSRRLALGQSLSEVTDDFRRRLGIRAALLPMSDNPVHTIVESGNAELSFQDYFVKQSCRPPVTGFHFEGAAQARASPHFLDALACPGLSAVVICPSNPFISVDPMLAIPGVREALARCQAPKVAVAPIVGGRAIKGPTAKMMRELGLPVDATAVAAHYRGLLDGFVMDEADRSSTGAVSVATLCTGTLMSTIADRESLAGAVLAFASELRAGAAAKPRP